MPKISKIRWRESDLNELQKEIRKFNRRVAYQQKKHPDADFLPVKKDFKTERDKIVSRSDLQGLLKSMSKFGAKTAAPVKGSRGVTMTKWEVKEDVRLQKILKKREIARAEALLDKPVTQGGKDTGSTRRQMGKLKEQPYKIQIANPLNRSKAEWEAFKKHTDKALRGTYDEERAKLWQRNYIKGLIRVGMPEDVVKMVQSVTPQEFAEALDLDEYGSIDFIYDPMELAAKADLIRETWQNRMSDSKMVSDETVETIEHEVEDEAATGYAGRHFTENWRAWEYEHRKAYRKGGKK